MSEIRLEMKICEHPICKGAQFLREVGSKDPYCRKHSHVSIPPRVREITKEEMWDLLLQDARKQEKIKYLQ